MSPSLAYSHLNKHARLGAIYKTSVHFLNSRKKANLKKQKRKNGGLLHTADPDMEECLEALGYLSQRMKVLYQKEQKKTQKEIASLHTLLDTLQGVSRKTRIDSRIKTLK